MVLDKWRQGSNPPSPEILILLIIGRRLTYYPPLSRWEGLIEFCHQVDPKSSSSSSPSDMAIPQSPLCRINWSSLWRPNNLFQDQIPKWEKNGLTREMKFLGVVTALYSTAVIPVLIFQQPKYPLLMASSFLPCASMGVSFPYVCVAFLLC